MKRLEDLRVGDVVYVYNVERDSKLKTGGTSKVKITSVSEKSLNVSYLRDPERQLTLKFTEYNIKWFINNPEEWNSF